MALGLKDKGREDIGNLIRRVRRELALNRIYPEDAEFLTKMLQQIDAHIVAMPDRRTDKSMFGG